MDKPVGESCAFCFVPSYMAVKAKKRGKLGGWKFTNLPKTKGRRCSQPICANTLAAVLSVAVLRRPASWRCRITIQARQCFARIGVIAGPAQLSKKEWRRQRDGKSSVLKLFALSHKG